MRINEIFYSLQGEGRWTGTPAVFVRFAGCNLKCDFCDTDHEPYNDYTEAEILQEIAAFPAKHIILTGGEPTLQLTRNFLVALCEEGYFVQIETNGTTDLSDEMLAMIDWVTCSPKFGLLPKIRKIDEIKVVYEGQDVSMYEALGNESTQYCLQPCDRHDEELNRRNLAATINAVMQNPKWKLSLQTHKILNVR